MESLLDVRTLFSHQALSEIRPWLQKEPKRTKGSACFALLALFAFFAVHSIEPSLMRFSQSVLTSVKHADFYSALLTSTFDLRTRTLMFLTPLFPRLIIARARRRVNRDVTTNYFRFSTLFLLLVALLLVSACASRDPQAEWRAALNTSRAKFRACLPGFKPESTFKLAIASVSRQPNETNLRLVVYTTGEAADFYLPAYYLSRGRWTIHEQGRAYLLDDECREYNLRNRQITTGQTATPEGLAHLEAWQAFEVTLTFPRLPDETREGVLVYDTWVLPFSLLIEAP